MLKKKCVEMEILILDDHTQLYTETRKHFADKGYDVEIAESDEILNPITLQSFNLVLLEIMSFEARWDVCKKVRQATDAPILIVTTNANVQEKVLGFSMGADDYVTKPFDQEELWARMKALLRRWRPHVPQTAEPITDIHFHDLVMRPEAREVSVGEHQIELTPKEFELLFLLASQPSKVFDRNELLRQVWGDDFKGAVRTVDSHVKNIRAKLKKAGLDKARIVTAWSVGYKFEEVKESVEVKKR